MFQAILNQEKKLRKELQDMVRDLVSAQPETEIGGDLVFNSEHQYVEALNILNNPLYAVQSADAKQFEEDLQDAFKAFKEQDMEASLSVTIQFDSQDIEYPENQTYDIQLNVSMYGLKTDAMPLTDYVAIVKILKELDVSPKFDDDVVF